MAHIILLESQNSNLRAWERLALSEGHLTHSTKSFASASDLITKPEVSNPVLVVESDLFDEMLERIKKLKELRPGLAAIMVSKNPKIDEIAACVRLGITDYHALDAPAAEIARSLNQAVNRAASQELNICLKIQQAYQDDLIATREQKSNDLRLALARLIQQRDHERENLAQILHDGLSQDLLALKLSLKSLSSRSDQFEHFYANLDQLSEVIRSISHRLSLRTRLTGDLKEDLSILSRQYLNNSPIELKEELDQIPRDLDKKSSYTILRFFNEALNSLVKLSGASQAVIGFDQERAEFYLSDNGQGWGLEPDGLEFLVMQEYARSLEAKFSISNFPGRGSKVALGLNLGISTD